jgi:hypothetical protein
MRRVIGPLFALLLGAAGAVAAPAPQAPAQDPGVRRTLDAFNAARPAESDLRVFQLDWASSLTEARARALKEDRPIFFVSTTQLEDAGNLRGGHC